jgi:hypothetical protein
MCRRSSPSPHVHATHNNLVLRSFEELSSAVSLVHVPSCCGRLAGQLTCTCDKVRLLFIPIKSHQDMLLFCGVAQ